MPVTRLALTHSWFGVQDEISVLGRIGEGAFGEVSLATSPIFGQVAIKWLKPGKVSVGVGDELSVCWS